MTAEWPIVARREFARAFARKRRVDIIHIIGQVGLRVGSATTTLLAVLGVLLAYAFGLHVPRWVVGLSAIVIVLIEVVGLYLRGDARWSVERRLGIISGSLAGNIDSVAQNLYMSGNQRLTESTARALCVGFLHRIAQYSQLILETSPAIRIRVTLAVPLVDQASGLVTHLRVWCYDQPYEDRHWSTIPIGLPGSPTAFSTCRIEVIADLRNLDGIGDLVDRRFRSILSIPVMVGGPSGECVAVVNLDATPPHFFNPDLVDRVLPILMPTVSCIAVVLLHLDDTAVYEFRR
jgi:hypothetical protein